MIPIPRSSEGSDSDNAATDSTFRIESVPEDLVGSTLIVITTDPSGKDLSAILTESASIDFETGGLIVSSQCVNRPPGGE